MISVWMTYNIASQKAQWLQPAGTRCHGNVLKLIILIILVACGKFFFCFVTRDDIKVLHSVHTLTLV